MKKSSHVRSLGVRGNPLSIPLTLETAIVNSEKLERYASIPEEERKLAEELIFRPTDEAIATFTAHFRVAREKKLNDDTANLTVEERLAKYIVEGTKEGLTKDLEI